jgi:hydroxymethylbilane synthase
VRMSATGDPADADGVGNRLAGDMLAEGAARLTDTPKKRQDA